jgi:hypothetical protein
MNKGRFPRGPIRPKLRVLELKSGHGDDLRGPLGQKVPTRRSVRGDEVGL